MTTTPGFESTGPSGGIGRAREACNREVTSAWNGVLRGEEERGLLVSLVGSISPDALLLVTATANGSVNLYETRGWTQVRDFHAGRGTSRASFDGTRSHRVLTEGPEQTLEVVSLPTAAQAPGEVDVFVRCHLPFMLRGGDIVLRETLPPRC